ncbi:MAG TPA: DUF6055 domain-containing protein, partial [Candidatus Goldiibacteriota bacterium]|nr:DUF6055 domain-containing protein [Candidatus Goldiibacteriota bacterium]
MGKIIRLAVLSVAILVSSCVFGATKTVFIPNEFTTLNLDWSWERSYQSDNFVVFWGSLVGTDPTQHPTASLRFNPATICATLETVYAKYITEIGFCSDTPDKNLGKYKLIIMMNETWSSPNGPTGWAFGGTYSNTIGAMWVHPQATADGNVISHELAHSLQGMIRIQENPAGGYVYYEPAGFFWECHANFMRSQMYPAAAYAYDMPRWLMTAMFHWSSTRHHYDSFRPLFVLQEKYGINFVNRMWKESINNEHPVSTIKRIMPWTQAQMNDFFYEYSKREITSDYPVNGFGTVIKNEMTRLYNNEPHYLWRLYTMLRRVDGYTDRYIVPDEFAPQDYGYNIIPIYPENTSLPVCVKFKGHTEANTYCGWRYGFVAVTSGGVARYQSPYSQNDNEISYLMAPDENKLYLVVTGAPVTHTSYVWEPGWPKIKRYPYEVRLQNAVPEGYQANFRADIRAKFPGSYHANGGGWKANSATVASTVYIGPKAVVLGSSNITGNVRIDGTAWVENARVMDNVIIDGNARVRGGTYSGNARLTGNAILYSCTVSGSVIAKDDMFSWGGTFSGDAVIGGDAEIGSATTGVYLQTPHANNGRVENDGKGET